MSKKTVVPHIIDFYEVKRNYPDLSSIFSAWLVISPSNVRLLKSIPLPLKRRSALIAPSHGPACSLGPEGGRRGGGFRKKGGTHFSMFFKRGYLGIRQAPLFLPLPPRLLDAAAAKLHPLLLFLLQHVPSLDSIL